MVHPVSEYMAVKNEWTNLYFQKLEKINFNYRKETGCPQVYYTTDSVSGR